VSLFQVVFSVDLPLPSLLEPLAHGGDQPAPNTSKGADRCVDDSCHSCVHGTALDRGME
jgi:hypothetical protein